MESRRHPRHSLCTVFRDRAKQLLVSMWLPISFYNNAISILRTRIKAESIHLSSNKFRGPGGGGVRAFIHWRGLCEPHLTYNGQSLPPMSLLGGGGEIDKADDEVSGRERCVILLAYRIWVCLQDATRSDDR